MAGTDSWTSATDATCKTVAATSGRCYNNTQAVCTKVGNFCPHDKCVPAAKCVCMHGKTSFTPVYADGARVAATFADADVLCKDKNKCAAAGSC